MPPRKQGWVRWVVVMLLGELFLVGVPCVSAPPDWQGGYPGPFQLSVWRAGWRHRFSLWEMRLISPLSCFWHLESLGVGA